MDLTKYILIFFSCMTINAQQSTSLKEDRFNSSLISPTIVHGEMYFSGITNGNNKTIVSFNAYKDTGYEKYDFGATFINSYPMTSGMLYITKDCDWFVVSLSIGAYKFNNRSASYSGAYLSHNYNSGYFGFGMADIIDVGFKNGTEDDFFTLMPGLHKYSLFKRL
ncbi:MULTISPECIES: hypothetical protein [Arenibacter]|uniref:hypothetical protein n=1 Tax=Arenibacter TaxID=178469 RepID=UPI0004DF5D67|nr:MULTISPECIES: hypothetical protein [Arenibacter]GBF21779.1 hypothetical protein C21_03967 [Arenibacter sp. NBRC 103722]